MWKLLAQVSRALELRTTMASFEEIKIGELPEAVIEAAARDVANYSIGFLDVKSPPRSSQDVTLLGSGTLVSIGSTHAILTAHHVLSVLPRSGRLGLILSPTIQQYTIDILYSTTRLLNEI